MTEAILLAIEAVSFVVIVIIMAVMANTMAMTARERYAEYATLKALGFSNGFVALLIFAESLGIALVGGVARHRADDSGRRGVRRARWARSSRCSSSRDVDDAHAGCAAAAHRRRRGRVSGVARGAACASSTACGPWRSDADPVLVHRAQPRGAPADDGAHRGRDGARRLRVRDGADARGRTRETLVTTGQPTTSSSSAASAQTEVQSGVDRLQAGIVESLPDIVSRARRSTARVEGAGRAHQPAEARHRQAVERHDSRRHARRRRAATRR